MPTVEACRTIADDRDRLACYDAAIDARAEPARVPVVVEPAAPQPPNPPNPPPAPSTAVKPEAVATPSVVTEEPVAPPPPTPARRPAWTPPPPPPPPEDTLDAVVMSIEKSPLGRLTIDLDNGQRWAQTDATPFVLHVGDRVNVKHTRFGAWLLEIVGSGRGLPVKLEPQAG